VEEKMKRNGIFAVLTLVTALLLVTGCKKETTESVKDETKQITTTVAEKVVEVPKTKYPEKVITVIVPYGAGGGTDVGTRIITKYAEKYLNGSFVIKNVEGGGGEIGFGQMVRSNPDGYTLSAMTLGHVTLTTTREASYDPTKDIIPVSLLVQDPSFLVVRSDDTRFSDIDSFLAYAKANPSKVTIGTSGAGSSDHIGVMAIMLAKGLEINAVHFNGANAAKAAMLGGHVDAFMPTTGEVLDLVKEGKAKMLGTSAETRLVDYPNVPTFNEKGINAPITATRGFAAPIGTPAEIIEILDAAFEKVSNDTQFLSDMADLGLPIKYLDHVAYQKLIVGQTAFFQEMATHLKGESK